MSDRHGDCVECRERGPIDDVGLCRRCASAHGDDYLLDAVQVSALTRRAPSTLRQHRARDGVLEPHRHFGRSPAWKRGAVERWMETARRIGRPRISEGETE